MEIPKKVFGSIDEYLESLPPEIRVRMEQIRRVVHDAVPEVEERISYNMPTFWFKGSLVYYCAFKKHIGFYPAGDAVFETFKKEMEGFKQSGRGTIQFPHDKPLPLELIRKIASLRAAENTARTKPAPPTPA